MEDIIEATIVTAATLGILAAVFGWGWLALKVESPFLSGLMVFTPLIAFVWGSAYLSVIGGLRQCL